MLAGAHQHAITTVQVLVPAATGGIGLAAVQVARFSGCQVLATASTPVKRAYLRRLGVASVGDSRSVETAESVLLRTHGAGAQLVLNALTSPGAQG